MATNVIHRILGDTLVDYFIRKPTTANNSQVIESEGVAWLVFLVALFQFLFFTFWTLDQPIVDRWGFRPAQTAISVFYMLRGSGWFANIVPVFGEPWVLSQEFPLYQWCVALLSFLTGASIDACGRVVAASFAVAVLWPISLLAKDILGAPARRFALLVSGMWLLAPIVVFWGRSVLIETTAVFFGLGWLAFYVRFLKNGRPTDYFVCIIFGILAATIKITAFAGFAVGGFLYTFVYMWNRLREPIACLLRVAIAGTSLVFSAAALFAWNWYATGFLLKNPLAAMLSVSNIPQWYFGVLSDRFGSPLWDWTIRLRALPDTLGSAWFIPGLLILYLIFRNPRFAILSVGAVLSFLSVYMAFPQLYMHNPYYDVENAIFICVAAVAVVEGILRWQRTIVAYSVLGICIVSQILRLYGQPYGPLLFDDLHHHPYYEAGLALKAATPPDSVIVVFGTGFGADLPYFAQRKGIVVPNWMPPGMLRRMIFDERDRWLGGRKLSAVVNCAVFENQRIARELEPVLDQFKHELHGRTIDILGSFYGATVNPPKCTIYLSGE